MFSSKGKCSAGKFTCGCQNSVCVYPYHLVLLLLVVIALGLAYYFMRKRREAQRERHDLMQSVKEAVLRSAREIMAARQTSSLYDDDSDD